MNSDDESPDGFGSAFYVMLVLGIVGVIGFLLTAASV